MLHHIITLGPQGTFSDEATRSIVPETSKIEYALTLIETLLLAKSKQCPAIVPIENSVEGVVTAIQDLLVSEDFVICGELNKAVCYDLLSVAPLNQIKKVFAHEQASGQSREFLKKYLPHAIIELTASNIASGKIFLDLLNQNKQIAAIVPPSFARSVPHYILHSQIQDYQHNTTRFILIQTRPQNYQPDFSHQKTSIQVQFSQDRPGLLYELLSIFHLFQINLCRLESRPSKKTAWNYVFFIDLLNSKKTEDCLEVMRIKKFEYHLLGTYSKLSTL